jgi:DNA methyltransferase 1-associated protein 1
MIDKSVLRTISQLFTLLGDQTRLRLRLKESGVFHITSWGVPNSLQVNIQFFEAYSVCQPESSTFITRPTTPSSHHSSIAMASSKDVRDIMGFQAAYAGPPPPAKKKASRPSTGKRLTGISREVVALHGDRAPPISVVESAKTYRKGLDRDRKFKPAHWDLSQFENSARSDGLVLKHWRKQKPSSSPSSAEGTAEQKDAMEVDGEVKLEQTSAVQQTEYEFAKYNITIIIPTYTDEQYHRFLADKDWSREETEYLLELIKEYDQRWHVISDRYDWQPSDSSLDSSEDSMAVARLSDVKSRDLESLKARYYYICARVMEFALPNGVAGMNTEEFTLHSQYAKYKAEPERQRKTLTWALCRRNPEEVREEEFLLSELQRIMISAQKFETDRAELRQRLEYAQPLNGASNASLSLSSQSLTLLYNQLIQQDRNRKPRARISLDALQSPATAGTGLVTPASAGGHRESVGGSGQKKGSTAAPVPISKLSPKQETRFGVTTHDRLTSGVAFRTDRLLKLRQAKSQIQTQKINHALAHLEIPDLLPLPTTRVVEMFEGLIQKINLLLDARKVLAKEEIELQTALQIKADLQKQEAAVRDEIVGDGDADAQAQAQAQAEAQAEAPGAGADADTEGDADADADADGEDVEMLSPPKETEPEPVRPSSSRSNAMADHKRSASVLSTASSRGSRRKR